MMIKYTTKYCKACGPIETESTSHKCKFCGSTYGVEPRVGHAAVANLRNAIAQKQMQLSECHVRTRVIARPQRTLAWLFVPLAFASFVYGFFILGVLLLFLSRKSI